MLDVKHTGIFGGALIIGKFGVASQSTILKEIHSNWKNLENRFDQDF